jgi:hypothetical protein
MMITANQYRAMRLLAAPVSSHFLDRNSTFAKEDPQVDHIDVSFADSNAATLSVDEFSKLSNAEQDEIRNAGVSVTAPPLSEFKCL